MRCWKVVHSVESEHLMDKLVQVGSAAANEGRILGYKENTEIRESSKFLRDLPNVAEFSQEARVLLRSAIPPSTSLNYASTRRTRCP